MNKIINNNNVLESVTVDGLMTFGKLENGLRTADFMCVEDVVTEACVSNFRVQMMRDGNVYMTELRKRIRNKAIFRDDNCSLSLGQDGKYYFYFSMPKELVDELPRELVRQAGAIASKVLHRLTSNN